MIRRTPQEVSLLAGQLAQGISRQPPHLRTFGMVQDATNADFLLAEGIVKRPGSLYGWKITGPGAGSNLRMHAIKPASGEKYLAVYGYSGGNHVLQIFNTDGTAATVTVSAAAETYIEQNTASADQQRLFNVQDATYIVNTTVASGTKASPNYTVTTDDWPDYDRMRSYTPAEDTYHQTLEDYPEFPAGYYFYDPGTATFCKWQSPLLSGSNFATPTGVWDNSAGSPYTFRIRFRKRVAQHTGCTWDNTAKTLTSTGSFTDYSHNSDDIIKIDAGTGWTPGWYSVASKVDANTLSLTEIGGAAISVAGSSDVGTDGIGVVYDVSYTTDGTALDDMHAVARRWQNALISAGCSDGLVAWVENDYQSGYFEITGPFRGSGRRILDIESVGSGTDMSVSGQPFDYSAGTATHGTGTDSPTLAVDSRWTRVGAPAQTDALPDPTKMPHKITRTVIGPPATFTVEAVTWATRLSGDSDTNPSPRILNTAQKIRSMGYFSDRLFIAGGPYIAFAEIKDTTNFYIIDPDTVVDSDALDLSPAGSALAGIDHAVPWRDTLAIFTLGSEQYTLTGDGAALTPESAYFTPSTSFFTLSAFPEPLGQNLYFAGSGGSGGNAQLLETFYDFASSATDASDVSAHVPGLLPDDIRRIACHANTRRVFLLKKDDNTIYVYRSHLRGNEKVQSAWTKWSFPQYTISDIVVLDDDLWMLVQSALAFHIERIPLSPESEASGYPFVVRGDRRMTLTGVHSTGTTTWTLPSSLSDTTINAIVLGSAFGSNAGVIHTPTTTPGTTVTLTGDYSAGSATLCRSYDFDVELSRPYLRDEGGRPVLLDTIIQRKMLIEHRDAGSYTVRLDRPSPSSDHTESFTAAAKTVASGQFSAWASGNLADKTLSIESSDVRPLSITAVNHIGDTADEGGLT